MATKKKTKKKSTGSKTATARKSTPTKKPASKKKTPKKPGKRKAAVSKTVEKKKSPAKKAISRKTAGARPRNARKESETQDLLGFSETSRSRSGGQSGDLQGLPDVESADSESVDELIEEGNPFEAGVVSGVEESGDRGEREVRTREVPEDDVPDEYLDEQ